MSKCQNCQYAGDCNEECVYDIEFLDEQARTEIDIINEYEAIWEKMDSKDAKEKQLGRNRRAFLRQGGIAQ